MNAASQTPSLVSPEFKARAHELYAHLRADEPLHALQMPDGMPTWMVTRYDDVVSILKDERFVNNMRNALPPEITARLLPDNPYFRILSSNMLVQDAPEHDRLRNLVHKAFTPRMIEGLRLRIQEICDRLLDNVQARGEMDVIADYALPIPVTVICELLGIPESERGKFHELSSAILSAGQTMAELAKVAPQMKAFIEYIDVIAIDRRAHPGSDLISALISIEAQDDRLSQQELMAMIMLLLTAGHETTVNLIGNGVYMLLKHPDQMTLLRNHPALIGSAIEELLRFCSPVEIASMRFAREDVTLYGQTIAKGSRVLLVLGSGNRDSTKFDAPDTLDITRPNNQHLAFGMGIHYCLGAPLARLEGQIALPTLLHRMPNLTLKDTTFQWRPSLLMRGLVVLPVTF